MTSLWFVMPEPASFVSGGNRYNAELLRELAAFGLRCELLPPFEAARRFPRQRPDLCLVDTLHLADAPALCRRAAGVCPVALLVHYLPSLLERIVPEEREALVAADGACATSSFMRQELVRRGMREARVFVAEPGQSAGPPLWPARPSSGVRALLVANLAEAKGVLPLLEALDAELTADDALELRIAGGDAEAAYAERCRRIARRPALRDRVRFLGPLSHQALLLQMHEANLFVSASRMESYGMALAEARVTGLPIVAQGGGNVAQHVEPRAGGEWARTARELAQACAALCRSPQEHRRRLQLARSAAPEPRPWSRVAEDFIAGCQALTRAYE